MSATPLRMAVVGLGWVAQARHIPAIMSNRSLELVGVIDRSSGRAADVAQRHGIAHHAEASDLGRIGWLDEVDALSIATAPMAHRDLACEALARGHHVITEKPFAMTVEEGREMCATAKANARALAVVHNFQFARSMRSLMADIEAGRLGRIQGVRAVQLGNPSRRLPTWFEELPLGLFYDESPHLLYLLRRVAGPLSLKKSVVVNSRHGNATPAQIDVWFGSASADFPITMSCNFESGLSEWHLMVHGEHRVGIVDVFRDIYLRLPNDRAHATGDVLRTSIYATAQHWAQHVTSGVPHLMGRLLYGNREVFGRFAATAIGIEDRSEPIAGPAALETLTLQHQIIAERESINT
jgi:scyllo-inositol 2-dehydrogenase (NADP+)